MADGHRTAELRSIELHRLVAEQLDQDGLTRARARVMGWIDTGGPVHPEHARAWAAVLSQPLDKVRAKLVEDSERLSTLRSCSPFAGALDEQQRQSVIRRIK